MIEFALVTLFVVALLIREYMFIQEKRDWATERRELLNRIKPETAQWTVTDTPELVEPVRDDADYWVAHEQQIKDDGTFPYGGESEAIGR